MEDASRRIPLFVAALPYLFGMLLLRRSHLQEVHTHAAPVSEISRNAVSDAARNDISTSRATHVCLYPRTRVEREIIVILITCCGAAAAAGAMNLKSEFKVPRKFLSEINPRLVALLSFSLSPSHDPFVRKMYKRLKLCCVFSGTCPFAEMERNHASLLAIAADVARSQLIENTAKILLIDFSIR